MEHFTPKAVFNFKEIINHKHGFPRYNCSQEYDYNDGIHFNDGFENFLALIHALMYGFANHYYGNIGLNKIRL